MPNSAKKLFINGRFLTQGLTGVQRVACEIIQALDTLLAEGKMPPELQRREWIILTPKNTTHNIQLRVIRIEETGNFKGHIWEQIDLLIASYTCPLLSFCNAGPILHPRQFVMIHDAAVYRHPEFYSKPYRMLHQLLGRILVKTAMLGTVSNFSRQELGDALNILPKQIGVIYNGVDHMRRIVPDTSILDKLQLQNIPFFLCIGSLTKNKNVQVAVDAFLKLNRPDARLVIVGSGNEAVFGTEKKQYTPNIIQAGRLTDAEIAGLYTAATAFVFPSIYEGFGLPPMEAMNFGCPVLASRAQAVQEVCSEAATYFDARDANSLVPLMQSSLGGTINRANSLSKQRAQLEKFTWNNSALQLAQFINERFFN